MYIRAICGECFRQQDADSEKPLFIEFTTTGGLMTTCGRGHLAPLTVQEFDFQIIFDVGCMALLDGYSREAVTGIFLAIERLHECYINVVVTENEINEGVLEEVWRRGIGNRSERELGAFLFVYLMAERCSPPDLNRWQEWSEFRNQCVHKGKIPPENEVIDFGEALFSHGQSILNLMREKSEESLGKEIGRHVSERLRDWDTGEPWPSLASVPTMLSVNRGRSPNEFRQHLEGLKEYRGSVWSSTTAK